MSHKLNTVRVLTAATGNSSPITLGAKYSQLFMLPSEAGAMDGRTYSYRIVDGNNWEYGRGVYTASGTTLSRNVIQSWNGSVLGTSRISLSGTAQVFFPELAEDMDGMRGTRPVTGTSDTLNNSDMGYAVTYSNASAVAVSLAQAGTAGLFLDGWTAFVKNKGAGAVTITPATSTIDGAATLVLAQNQGAIIWSDGTNYQTLKFRGDLGTAAVRADTDFVRGDAAQSLTSTQQAQARANAGVLGRNRIINGQFTINQRGAVSVADNAYGPDRFRVIGEFATGTIFTDSFDAAGGSVFGGALQFGGTTDKGGYFQVIEGHNCKDLRGKTVTLSMRLVVNNARLGNMKMGILEWTGTEDGTTGDPVSSWGADGVTPTLATNWAFKNTPANLGVTTSSAVFSTTVTLGSTFNNLAVMIWNDDKSYTAGDNFGITNVQLEEGGVATPYDQRIYAQEFALSLPYFESFGGYGLNYEPIAPGFANTSTNFYALLSYAKKIRLPDITWSSVGNFVANTAAGAVIATGISVSTSSRQAAQLAVSGSGFTSGGGGSLQGLASNIAKINVNAEI